jgi:hypothetical protein
VDWWRLRPDWMEIERGSPADTAGTWEAEVLAVADGRVVEVVDGIPDNPLDTVVVVVPITWETIAGCFGFSSRPIQATHSRSR